MMIERRLRLQRQLRAERTASNIIKNKNNPRGPGVNERHGAHGARLVRKDNRHVRAEVFPTLTKRMLPSRHGLDRLKGGMGLEHSSRLNFWAFRSPAEGAEGCEGG